MEVKFIKLTPLMKESKIYNLNPVFISSIDEETDRSVVKMMNGDRYTVKETLKEINDLIKKSNFLTIKNI